MTEKQVRQAIGLPPEYKKIDVFESVLLYDKGGLGHDGMTFLSSLALSITESLEEHSDICEIEVKSYPYVDEIEISMDSEDILFEDDANVLHVSDFMQGDILDVKALRYSIYATISRLLKDVAEEYRQQSLKFSEYSSKTTELSKKVYDEVVKG
jgi:hypothetical protein